MKLADFCAVIPVLHCNINVTMKVKIESRDRVGISQEILAKFASKAWNVKSIEVESQFTYVHLDNETADVETLLKLLSDIDGIKNCIEISEMPAEVREKHVQALLAKISDPILDIDDQGKILACNRAAQLLVTGDNITKQNIGKFIDVNVKDLLQKSEFSIAVNFLSRPFIADINPVITNNITTGAVIYLKSVKKLGRQLSLVQETKDDALNAIIGNSPAIKLIIAQIQRFADLDLPVLITGETGTGKELVARALHQLSPRNANPFLSLNCAAIPEPLLESELFGYESGAFTGAKRSGKPGLIELADGGTIFLDEIAEMSNYLQAKLLRFLQDLTYRKVGGTKELNANVKIITASHQNFNELIINKTFREDLYYRINVLKIQLPPLSERKSDIEILTHHFIVRAAQQLSHAMPSIEQEAMNLLVNFDWPGNIRQLENTIFKLVAMCDENSISAEDVLQVVSGNETIGVGNLVENEIQDWNSAQAEFEKQLLVKLYPMYPSTRKLADRLNVSHNKIAMKLRAYNIKTYS
ncbi:sigma 54-interacting transcriptional regulator [Thalassotalea marina]|uniref:sigma 54-interacting transcriptional regulator n=1 Tax=Thalassotalea marina TaxID=1673741 RepID=UPI001E44B11A|nr:sigma 54-interacting transcriptional regulator [Thalassotalea marina]